jgi:hypothetical protein
MMTLTELPIASDRSIENRLIVSLKPAHLALQAHFYCLFGIPHPVLKNLSADEATGNDFANRELPSRIAPFARDVSHPGTCEVCLSKSVNLADGGCQLSPLVSRLAVRDDFDERRRSNSVYRSTEGRIRRHQDKNQKEQGSHKGFAALSNSTSLQAIIRRFRHVVWFVCIVAAFSISGYRANRSQSQEKMFLVNVLTNCESRACSILGIQLKQINDIRSVVDRGIAKRRPIGDTEQRGNGNYVLSKTRIVELLGGFPVLNLFLPESNAFALFKFCIGEQSDAEVGQGSGYSGGIVTNLLSVIDCTERSVTEQAERRDNDSQCWRMSRIPERYFQRNISPVCIKRKRAVERDARVNPRTFRQFQLNGRSIGCFLGSDSQIVGIDGASMYLAQSPSGNECVNDGS